MRIDLFDQPSLTPIIAKKYPAPNVKIPPEILENRHATP
jgi:hypothetical protein